MTFPNFSIDAVFFQPTNMVSLFQGSDTRYFQLLNEMQMAFLSLRRFLALAKLEFGLDLLETRRLRGYGNFGARVSRNQAAASIWVPKNPDGRLLYNSFMLETMEEAKHLAPTVKVGIWWTSGRGGLKEVKARRAQEEFLEYLRAKVGPV
jgi:hypothetical protein